MCYGESTMKSEYHMFLCDISGAHEPIAAFQSHSPFPNLTIGQRFDDHGWDRLREVGRLASEDNPIRYLIHSIKTTIYVEGNSNIIQTWLNLEPFDGERSPAFGCSDPTMSSNEALS